MMQGKSRVEIEEKAVECGCDDAGSLYPLRYTNYRLLRSFGRAVAINDYQLGGRQAKLFASEYASSYRNEIDTFDRDECYEYYGITDLAEYLAAIV